PVGGLQDSLAGRANVEIAALTRPANGVRLTAFMSEAQRHVEAVEPQVATSAVVEGRRVVVAVVTDLRPDLEQRVHVVAQSERVARVIAREPGGRAVLVLGPLIADGHERG